MNNHDGFPLLQTKYRLIRKIGEGSFSVVYLGEHVDKKTKVAIKFDKNNNEVATKLIKHETQMYLELLKHKIEKIASIKSFGVYKDKNYLIMEYLPFTLEHYVKENKGKTLKLFHEILNILTALHENGFVHRDIKPDNFLVNPRGKVYLIDFGLACIIDKTKSLKNIIGSAMYCSYRLYESVPYDPVDDMISVHYMFFYLCTNGILPWGNIFVQDKSVKYNIIHLLKKNTDYYSFYLYLNESNDEVMNILIHSYNKLQKSIGLTINGGYTQCK